MKQASIESLKHLLYVNGKKELVRVAAIRYKGWKCSVYPKSPIGEIIMCEHKNAGMSIFPWKGDRVIQVSIDKGKCKVSKDPLKGLPQRKLVECFY